jgi:hypothetical protein
MIPVFEWVKTVNVSDRGATVIGFEGFYVTKIPKGY